MPSRFTILLLEEEYLIALDMDDMLREVGFSKVLVCCDTSTSEKLLNSNMVDAAILDFHLGADTSEKIARRLIREGIPFIVASGGQRNDRSQALSKGGWIPKPCRAFDLDKALRKALQLPCTNICLFSWICC